MAQVNWPFYFGVACGCAMFVVGFMVGWYKGRQHLAREITKR